MGQTFNPANTARPGSGISGMMCAGRPIPQRVRARSARTRWAAGSLVLPGRSLSATMRSRSRHMRSGMNRNKPPNSVRKDRGSRWNARTSAGASTMDLSAVSRTPGAHRRSVTILCFCTVVVPVVGKPSSVRFWLISLTESGALFRSSHMRCSRRCRTGAAGLGLGPRLRTAKTSDRFGLFRHVVHRFTGFGMYRCCTRSVARRFRGRHRRRNGL